MRPKTDQLWCVESPKVDNWNCMRDYAVLLLIIIGMVHPKIKNLLSFIHPPNLF